MYGIQLKVSYIITMTTPGVGIGKTGSLNEQFMDLMQYYLALNFTYNLSTM